MERASSDHAGGMTAQVIANIAGAALAAALPVPPARPHRWKYSDLMQSLSSQQPTITHAPGNIDEEARCNTGQKEISGRTLIKCGRKRSNAINDRQGALRMRKHWLTAILRSVETDRVRLSTELRTTCADFFCQRQSGFA
jgi:hypothetical protein